MISQPPLTIPPLISGGVMLTYRCSNACKHCLYRCSPRHDDVFMSEEMIDRTFTALASERSLHGVHIAGGEATLNWERLLYAIDSARRHGVSLDYVETNGHWCDDEATARDGFLRMRKAGLPAVLVSASLFHNEFIPLAKTKAAVQAAIDVFGHGRVLIWTSEVLGMMDRSLDDDRTHPIRKSCPALGLDPTDGDLWRIHDYLIPGGRAAEQLADGLPHQPAEHFAGDSCGGEFQRTSHFHIDPFGNLFTGFCPGISVACVDELHPQITEQSVPVYCCLAEQGPVGVWRTFAEDFRPDPVGYISKCHLCLELRKHMHPSGRHEELRPAEFYQH